MRVPTLWAVLAASALSLSCTSDATQLVVLVDTDYSVPTEVARIAARVLDSEANEVSSQEFALTDAPTPDDPALFAVPLSFGVVPTDGNPSRRVIVEVDARDVDGRVRVTRRARTGFIPHRTLLLPMFLSRSCEGVACPSTQTCVDGECRDDAVTPEGLIVIIPGEELRLDASADAGRRDGGASADGAPSDGARSDGSLPLSCGFTRCACDVGYCDVSCTDINFCQVDCGDLGCSVAAEGSHALQVTCAPDAECTIDARDAMDAQIACGAGSTCTVDCSAASSCDVRCPDPTTRCTVECSGSPSCAIRSCGDAAGGMTCPGNVLVCGAPCP